MTDVEPTSQSTALLSIKNLSKSFGGVHAVKDVSFTVGYREIVGVIGPNGAGKSTLFNAVTGFDRPDSGQVVFDGKVVDGMSPNRRARIGLCRTFQTSQPFVELSVEDNVVIGALQQVGSVKEAKALAAVMLERVGLENSAKLKSGVLSLGNRRRLEVARALATGPKLLLLDEVMGGLTPAEVDSVMELIASLPADGVSVILIEHIMRAIMTVSDRIVVMHDGAQIAEGVPSVIAKDPKVVAAYLGEEYAFA